MSQNHKELFNQLIKGMQEISEGILNGDEELNELLADANQETGLFQESLDELVMKMQVWMMDK